MKITISKSHWESLETNNKLKKYSSIQINSTLYIKMSAAQWKNVKLAAYISHDQFVERMAAIGWDMTPEKSGLPDYIINSPDGKYKINVPRHNWDLAGDWRKPKQHIMAERAKSDKKKLADGSIIEVRRYKDEHLLDFVFKQPFKIPPKFNKNTQEIDVPEIANVNQYEIELINIKQLDLNGREVEMYNEKGEIEIVKPVIVDVENNQIFTEDGRILTIKNPRTIRSIKR